MSVWHESIEAPTRYSVAARRHRLRFQAATFALTLLLAACGGGSSGSNSNSDATPSGGTGAATVTLHASTATLASGASATLSWTSANASAVSISPGVGSVTPVGSGSVSVSPKTTTTYTATATGSGNNATQSVTINVSTGTPAPSVTLAASPATLTPGQSSVLSWTSSNATSLSINQGVGAVTPVASGSVNVTPSATTTYTVTAKGPGGTTTAKAAVNVNASSSPTVVFTASPPNITAGGSSTLAWSTTHATSASISPSVGAVATSGSVSVSPSASTIYTISVSGPDGSTSAAVTVTVSSGSTVNLPSGYGWFALSNTLMAAAGPPDDPQGQCNDPIPAGQASGTVTCTTFIPYAFNSGIDSMIVPWSGGAGDDLHHRLIVFGGGHADYGGNEVMVLDLEGSAPAWTTFVPPSKVGSNNGTAVRYVSYNPYVIVSNGQTDYSTIGPGAAPPSVHSYDGAVYLPGQNSFYQFGGSPWFLGDFTPEVWSLNMGTAQWSMLQPYGQASNILVAAANPGNGHIVLYDGGSNVYDWDPATSTRTLLTSSFPAASGYYPDEVAAVDPVDNLFVVIAGDAYPPLNQYAATPTATYVAAVNLSSPGTQYNWSSSSFSCNGAPVYNGTGFEWDSALGVMVGYVGYGNALFFFNPSPNAVKTYYGTVPARGCLMPVTIGSVKGTDYPPDPVGGNASQYTGTFGRFRYYPTLDVFVLVNDSGNNAWILRLQPNPAP